MKRSLSFFFNSTIAPSGWRELYGTLGFSRGNRESEVTSLWWRLDGSGFTLWASELVLADSSGDPPLWQLLLESRCTLPPAGEEQWTNCIAELEYFLQAAQLNYRTELT